MIYTMGRSCMLIGISEKESGDHGKKAACQVVIVESYFLFKEIQELLD